MGIYWIWSIKKDRTLLCIMRPKNFPSASRIRVELIRRTWRHAFVHIVQRCWVAAGYRSRDAARCPRLHFDHRCHSRMLAQRHQNWNQQHWSHLRFIDESIVSFCNGHARGFRCVVERLEDGCIQENMECAGTMIREAEADPWPIIEYRMRSMLMVPLLGPVCQHVAEATMIRSQPVVSVWMSCAISRCY